MMKQIKKSLCILLVVVMCLASAPLQGFIGLELPIINFGEWFSGQASALATNGQCGDNVYWYFDENIGELTISGQGQMWTYHYQVSPFHEKLEIKTVIIEYGVTTIGRIAFWHCSSLTNIVIPDSVTSIGESAFSDCSSLADITIPDSVVSIGKGAFNGTKIFENSSNWEKGVLYIGKHLIEADSLLSGEYEIKKGTLTIADYAFEDCRGLTSIIIPDSVKNIGIRAFEFCACLTNISVPNSVTYIGEGAFHYCSSLTSITIGNSVITIGDCAFMSCISLAEITIPNSVLSIGDGAFSGCSGLTNITISDTLIRLGEGAFRNCSSLTSIFIPDNVTSIGDGAFYGCSSLTSISIPNNVTIIGDETFYNCSGIESVIIPDGITSIGYNAFRNCSNLKSLNIPNSVKTIGENVFRNCTNLTSVIIGDSVTAIGDYAFYECTSLTSIIIGDSVTYIGDYAFYGCENLTSVIIPDGVTKIERFLFYNCYNLTNVIIPDSVTSIGDYAFTRCYSLTNISIPNNVKWIGTQAFCYCTHLESINIPESVTSIGDYVFYNCTTLKNIFIPDSITRIGNMAFYSCKSLTSISVDKDNTAYSSDSRGVLFDKNKTKLILYPSGNMSESYTMPSSVTTIDKYAFSYCSAIVNIIFSDNLTTIDEYAFNHCYKLKDVIIPSNVTTLANGTFNYCYSIETVIIPENVSTVCNSVFYDCLSLTNVTIPVSVTSIGESSFRYCRSLTDVYYAGKEEQWKQINIGDYNECLTNASIHFGNASEEKIEVTNGYKREHIIENWRSLNQSFKANYLTGNAVPMDGTNGNPSYLIPGQAENMIPQGLAYWSEKDWILISSYDKEKENPSVIFALDRETGDFVAQFNLKKKEDNKIVDWLPHAGGIGVSNNNLYITNGGGISYFPLSELDVERGTVKDIVRRGYADISQLGNANVSYLDTSDGVLWAGNFYSNYPGISIWEELLELVGVLPSSWDLPADNNNDSLILGFKLTGSTSEEEWENLKNIAATATYRIGIPKGIDCIQGVTFKKISDTKCKMYLSRTTDVSFSASISSTTITLNKSQINPNKDDFWFCENLPGAENIIFIGDDLYTVYESGALSICDDLASQATWHENLKNCTDVIWKVNENALLQVPSVDYTWFENDAYSGYNHELSQFCAKYCVLGYCYNQDEIEYYLNKSGFALRSCEMNAERDEVNYFIADKDIIVNGNTKNLIFIGCIGSYNDQWYSNFDPWSHDSNNDYASFTEMDKTHQGFANAREYVYTKLNKYISENNIDRSNSIILFTGHSRGAATVNLLAAKLIDDCSSFGVDANNIYTYGFATPNTTKDAYGVSYNRYRSIINIVNPEDVVTKLLPSSWGYGRYGDTYTLPSKTNDNQYKAYLAKMKPYFEQYTGKVYDPYKKGELKTYEFIESFREKVIDLVDFYSKDFAYSIPLFGTITYETPYEFFRKTLLKFIVSNDMDEIVGVVMNGEKFYRDIILYFAWPDLSLSEATNAILSGNTILNGVELGGKFIQAHQMETYCSYINALTSSQVTAIRKGYKGTVNCPVDIEVYDKETGKLVGKIVDNTVNEELATKDNSVVMSVTGDSKSFWLPSNGDYEVKLIGNDEGTMDYTMSEIDSDIGEIKRVNFFDVKITDGLTLIANIKCEEFVIEEHKLINKDAETLEPTEVFDEDIETYHIDVSTSEGGSVSSPQTAKSGDYVYLAAIADAGWELTGWYENDELLSVENDLTFVAKSDRNLEARFEHVDHSFNEWYTVIPAKCEVVGMEQRDCSVCDYSETQGISATGHDFDGSKCRNCDYDKAANCECNCHKSGFMSIIWKVLRFFYKLFGTNKVCNCGVAHY